MSPLKIGFLGCGEVACIFSAALRERGADVAAYDIVRDRVAAVGLDYYPLAELLARSEYVLSTVTTAAARSVASECTGHLGAGHVYVDLNSTAPSVKVELNGIITPTGARFVEGAILGAVGVSGSATRILLGGGAGRAAAEALAGLGLHTTFYSEDIGRASTFKMLRSIFSKGLEALILELLVSGRRAGIERDLWEDVCGFMTKNPFDKVAANWIRSHAHACERRYHEMVQVAGTMRDLGLSPVMTAATVSFFDRSRKMDFAGNFPSKSDSIEDVVTRMEERLRVPEPGGSGES